jgi:meso-butanediol dehydrogenase/(S,S)-butanediol dehydrogenase/diacetyl reductase
MDRLRDTIAMITGGAGGIGAETARLFCAEGARVAIVDLDPGKLRDVAATISDDVSGAAILPVAADISREDEAARAVAETVAAFGGLTVLVNNAGVREFGPLAEASSESWRRIIDINLLGTANCAKVALPELRKADAASIVNVSSVHAEVGRKGMGQYDATKAAIVSMTRTWAWEEAEHGVRVNAVCPGGTLTPYHIARYGEQGMSEETLRAKQADTCLLGRWAEVREIAYPILWLASDEASFVTGAALMVDGGKAAM